jgi:hypothetical protein
MLDRVFNVLSPPAGFMRRRACFAGSLGRCPVARENVFFAVRYEAGLPDRGVIAHDVKSERARGKPRELECVDRTEQLEHLARAGRGDSEPDCNFAEFMQRPRPVR